MTINDLKEIDLLRKERTDLRRRGEKKATHLHDVVNGSLSYFPYTPTKFFVPGTIEKYADETQRLQAICAEKIAKKILEIEQWLASVESTYIRQIVRFKYIDGLPWRKVPVRMGLDGDGTTERKALNRYIKNLSANSAKSNL